MLLYLIWCICISTVYADDKTSGISQFWMDDFKVFDRLYGRTSDKELYGVTLPPSITYNIDITKPLHLTDKKELYAKEKFNPLLYNDFDSTKFLDYAYTKKKPALQFISLSNLKPISESSDLETYNYLKHLERMSEENRVQKSKTKKDPDAEADEAYKSIQEILDAHEANKKESDSNEDRPKSKGQKDDSRSRGRNRNKVRQIKGNNLKSREATRFRKSPSTLHVASRPYLRKIRYHFTS